MDTTHRPPAVAADPAFVQTRAPLFGIAAIAGPMLVLASSIAWSAGADGARGVLQFYGATGYLVTILVVAGALAPRMPRAAAVLAVTGVVGMAAGVGFAIDYLHEVVSGAESLADSGSLAGALAPTLPGLLGPLAWVGIGICLFRAGYRPRWAGAVLALAGVLFPLSRIGDMPLLAVADDLLFTIVLVPIGLALIQGRALLDA